MTIPTFRRPLALLAFLALGIAHADDKPACQYVQLGKIPLHYTGPGLQVTMDGTLNGTPALMLVDTGAFQTMLTRTGTEKRDMSLMMTGQSVRGIGGYSRVYSARVREIAAGPAKSAKGFLQVISDMGSAPAFDAIVGAPFLLQRDLEIDLAGKEIRFFQPLGCRDSFLAYWDREAVEIPFEYHGDASPNPHFTVELNGQKLEAIIDSGASTTVIEARAAKRAGLKLDAPNVVRTGTSSGVGERRAERWSTVVDTLKIGAETITNAQLGIIDTQGDLSVDMLLGDDFLRSHRVLFAMSQKKLYISYVGGEPLGQRRTLEPWIVKEAETGNPDAQLVLADVYAAGKLVPRDLAKAREWLEKAAEQGQPRANLAYGRKLMGERRWDDAAKRIGSALAQLPAERYGALWLYIARLHTGDPLAAKRELETTFARGDNHDWPAPIADFYLGKIDAEALMEAAGKEAKLAKARTCQANSARAEWHAAQGEDARAKSLLESVRAYCTAPPPEAKPADKTS
jgi:predicted aspartyl protease